MMLLALIIAVSTLAALGVCVVCAAIPVTRAVGEWESSRDDC